MNWIEFTLSFRFYCYRVTRVLIGWLALRVRKRITCNLIYSLTVGLCGVRSKGIACKICTGVYSTYLHMAIDWSLARMIRSWAESWVPPHLFPRVADLLCINACRHSGTHLCWMLAASSTICTVLWYDIYVQIVGWQFNRTARNVSDYFVNVRNFVTCESRIVSWVNNEALCLAHQPTWQNVAATLVLVYCLYVK